MKRRIDCKRDGTSKTDVFFCFFLHRWGAPAAPIDIIRFLVFLNLKDKGFAFKMLITDTGPATAQVIFHLGSLSMRFAAKIFMDVQTIMSSVFV